MIKARVSNAYSIGRYLEQPYIIIAGIMLLGAGTRLYHLAYKPLWLDEAVLYWISRGGLGDIVTQNAASNSAPPLFALLVALSSKVGESEATLRIAPWLAGVLAVGAIYLLSKEFLSPAAAYFCALTVAIATSQVLYSQQLREYSIAFLLAIINLLFFYRYSREPSWTRWALMTIAMIVGVFTQYGLALLVASLNLVFVCELGYSTQRRILALKWIASQILVLSAAVAVFQLSLKQQFVAGGFGASSVSNYLASGYWNSELRSLPKFALTNTIGLIDFAFPAAPLFLLLVLVGFVSCIRDPSGRRPLLILATPLLLTLVAACVRLYPYLGGRQDIFLTPMIYVFAGFGVQYLVKADINRLAALALLFVLVAIGGYSTYAYLQDPGSENIKPLIGVLTSSYQSGDRVYVYYGAGPAFRYYFRDNNAQLVYSVYARTAPEEYQTQLDSVFSKQGRVWMVFTHCWSTECQSITEYASGLRNVELVKAESDASLFLAR
jgi:Dolichyl-phosphate-mannose-protein mannosyltransferase